MWFGVDGVSVLYAEYDCAGFGGFGAGCNSLFLSSLSDGVKFIESVVLSKRGTGTSIAYFAKPCETLGQGMMRKNIL